MFVALGGSEAGFYPIGTSRQPGLGWYPAALLLLGLLGAAAASAGLPRRVPRAVLAGLALLAAYTAWSYLSISWAEQQGVAWDGANRTAVYLVVFALFGLWPISGRAATWLLAALGLGIAGLGLIELLKADGASEPLLYFIDARFAEPAGYINANVALWTLGLFLCLHIATSPQAHVALRGCALGGAGTLASLSLLGQSRGWVFAVPLAALVFLALTPHRARALTALAAVAIGVLAVSGSLLSVHDDFTPERFDALLGAATRDVLVLSALLALAGLLAAVIDRRVTLGEGVRRTANRAAALAIVLLLVLGGAATLVALDDPAGRLSDSWQTFKTGGEGTQAGGSRFASVGTNRYDFWRVAWERFSERPLHGIGSENFQQDYLARGNSSEQPRYPHSLVLGVLSQTGIVGALLLGGALLAGLLGGLATLRRVDARSAAVAGAAVTVFSYWLLHASVDWFWEFPGVTAPAFAMLAIASAIDRRAPAGAPARARLTHAGPRALAVASAVAGILLTVSILCPWLAEREVERAATGWRSSPTAAFERLDRAERFNPLSPTPHLVAATIGVGVEDQARAKSELAEVLELEPRTPFALAELAALASERGDRERAERLLERASGYAPNDLIVKTALEQVSSGKRLTVRELNDSYLEGARRRVGRN